MVTFPQPVPCALSRYDSSKSSTYAKCTNAGGCELFLPYGSGIVLGDIVSDTLNFGGLDVKGQLFGEATVEPGEVGETALLPSQDEGNVAAWDANSHPRYLPADLGRVTF